MTLSYSGAGVLEDCERKYCHQYIAKTPPDTDFKKEDYFSFGSCAHKVLEILNHTPHGFDKIDFMAFVKSFDLDPLEDGAKIAALLRNYWFLHLKSGLEVIACEVKFDFPDVGINGVIDAVALEKKDGLPVGFWIVDYKTTGMLDSTLPARIARDEQLTLYAGAHGWLAQKFDLKVPFLGVRLRESFKPRLKPKKAENFEEFTARCEESCKTRETVVLAKDLDIQGVYANFAEKSARAQELRQAFANRQNFVGRQNFKSCTKFGSPCQFWSNCYGRTYTESSVFATTQENCVSLPLEQVAQKTENDINFLFGE